MKKVLFRDVVDRVAVGVIDINCNPSKELLGLYDEAIEVEVIENSRKVLEILKENALIAQKRRTPICQDTGSVVCFVRLGNQVLLDSGLLTKAIEEGVEKGYREGYLRKSIVDHPLRRNNTGNNLPPIIHVELVEGDELSILLMAKGAGSENMSALRMLSPGDGVDGIKEFVIETVRKAGPNPCPPIIVGIGIGSNFEGVAELSKKALAKELLQELPEDPIILELEKELKAELNALGIGPQGFGGKTGVFEVKILTAPCHIASLPVAVNINCHVVRHAKLIF